MIVVELLWLELFIQIFMVCCTSDWAYGTKYVVRNINMLLNTHLVKYIWNVFSSQI